MIIEERITQRMQELFGAVMFGKHTGRIEKHYVVSAKHSGVQQRTEANRVTITQAVRGPPP